MSKRNEIRTGNVGCRVVTFRRNATKFEVATWGVQTQRNSNRQRGWPGRVVSVADSSFRRHTEQRARAKRGPSNFIQILSKLNKSSKFLALSNIAF